MRMTSVTAQKHTRREVVGIIARRQDFDTAIAALTAAGFEHADLSVLASHDSIDAAEGPRASWKEALTGLLGELRYQDPLMSAGFIAIAAAPLTAAPADAPALAAALRARRNDLAEAAISLAPPIATVLAALDAQPGCLLARMSGSGATCFGLFAREAEARAACRALRRAEPGWWTKAGAF